MPKKLVQTSSTIAIGAPKSQLLISSSFWEVQIDLCPDFSWDRVNFLSNSWYGIVFWVQYEKNVDNTLMFSVVER